MYKIVKLLASLPDKLVLISEDEFQELIYFGDDRMYKLSKEISQELLDKLQETDIPIKDCETLQEFLIDNGNTDVEVEYCDTYEESCDQWVLWDTYTWILDNLETYETTQYYVSQDENYNWHYDEIETIVEEIPEDLDWVCLDIWNGSNWCFAGSSTLHGYIVKYNNKWITKEESQYAGSDIIANVFDNEKDLFKWAYENDCEIWRKVDLEVEAMKDQLKSMLEDIDVKFGFHEKGIEFASDSDHIYTENSGDDLCKISNDPFTLREYEKDMEKVSQLYCKIVEIDPQFDVGNFH